jgi:hypothetical protein
MYICIYIYVYVSYADAVKAMDDMTYLIQLSTTEKIAAE